MSPAPLQINQGCTSGCGRNLWGLASSFAQLQASPAKRKCQLQQLWRHRDCQQLRCRLSWSSWPLLRSARWSASRMRTPRALAAQWTSCAGPRRLCVRATLATTANLCSPAAPSSPLSCRPSFPRQSRTSVRPDSRKTPMSVRQVAWVSWIYGATSRYRHTGTLRVKPRRRDVRSVDSRSACKIVLPRRTIGVARMHGTMSAASNGNWGSVTSSVTMKKVSATRRRFGPALSDHPSGHDGPWEREREPFGDHAAFSQPVCTSSSRHHGCII